MFFRLMPFVIAFSKMFKDAIFEQNTKPIFRGIIEINFRPDVFLRKSYFQFIRVRINFRMPIKKLT